MDLFQKYGITLHDDHGGWPNRATEIVVWFFPKSLFQIAVREAISLCRDTVSEGNISKIREKFISLMEEQTEKFPDLLTMLNGEKPDYGDVFEAYVF